MTNEEQTDADAARAAQYLKALLTSGVAHTDAVTMTTSYIGNIVLGPAMNPTPPSTTGDPSRGVRSLTIPTRRP